MSAKVLINGQTEGVISPFDRGLHYGDGLFETFLVQSGCLLFPNEHFSRLGKGCEKLGFPRPDETLIVDEINQTIGSASNGVVKLLLSRGEGNRGFMPPEKPTVTRIISFSPSHSILQATLKCCSLILCHTRLARQSVLAGIKHLNQLERVMARAELKDQSAEGLMLDTDGLVIEGTMSNLFIVKDKTLITPPLNNCGVHGTIREYLRQAAKRDNIEFKECELSLADVKRADEVFMTNSVMPLRSIDRLMISGTTYNMQKGPISEWALNAILSNIRLQIKRSNE
ncbi:MAG: aminodeoxychorismate lyase [Cycloclasticus sp.]|nr:aminodeoxychorismate lyase [Cycloclasticus sp.]